MKMKSLKKLGIMMLVIVMTTMSALPAAAAPVVSGTQNQIYHNGDTTITITVEDVTDEGVMPVDVDKVWLDQRWLSTTAYDETFTCQEQYGNTCNIWFDNRNGYSPILVNLDVEGFDTIPVQSIAVGKQTTIKISNDDRGLDEQVDVNVTTSSGDAMNFYIKARQFQVN